MDDLISRHDAIDALEKVAELYPWRVPGDRDSYSKYNEAWNDALDRAESEIEALPSAQPEIIYCKDCVKHNKGHGRYLDGTFIGIKDCCPLVEIRGMAQWHEFDYQYCVYAERRTDEAR